MLAVSASALYGAEILLRSHAVKAVSLSPLDKAWEKASPAVAPLIPQIFTTPHGGGSVKSVEARCLVTETDVSIRVSWEDATQNVRLDAGGRFVDACALEFPARENAMPSPFMGEKGNPVNVWHWRSVADEAHRYEKAYVDYYRPGAIDQHVAFATEPAQSLFAEGFGTLTPGAVQDVQAAGVWKDGRWTVVFRRALTSREGVSFKRNGTIPVAFAVWDGEDQERNGAKSLSLWHTLVVGDGRLPEPATPEEKGRRVFSRYGCGTCHGPGGAGGVKNLNAQGGEVPSINKVKDGFTEEEVEEVIRLGRRSERADATGPLPPLRMAPWGQIMDEREIHDLVKYLWTLAPKTTDW